MSKIDFTTPNAKAVEQMDCFFQESKWSRQGDDIGMKYYGDSPTGWSGVPKSDMTAAFYEYMALKTNREVTNEEIENY